jgi:uncharacterized repeat protein (TIGR03803 family)
VVIGCNIRQNRAVPAFPPARDAIQVRRLLPAMTHNPQVRLALSAICLILVAVPTASAEWKEKVLYSFQGGSDGQTPTGGVVFDKARNLYGANTWGGDLNCLSEGCGTVFQVSPPSQKGGPWTETVLHAFHGPFNGAGDGFNPLGGTIIDAQGNLYGTTSVGGNGPCVLLGSHVGCGMVYELSPPAQKGGPWTETILYNFQGGTDGYVPMGDLVFDKHGNLYGATWYGGGKGTNCNEFYGGNCGIVFELSPPKQKGGAWTEEILHRFAGVTAGKQAGDGADPNGGLVLDGNGAVYGTTYFGGTATGECGTVGCGTVYNLVPPTKKGGAWKEKILWRFNGSNGGGPYAGVTFHQDGDLYGTTVGGGNNGGGTVFELVPGTSGAWTETVLYRFRDGTDGANPDTGVVFDTHGDLYATAYRGDGNSVYGDVFALKPPGRKGEYWSFAILHGFNGPPDGAAPAGSLRFDKAGNLFGATQAGGTATACQKGCGAVYELEP